MESTPETKAMPQLPTYLENGEALNAEVNRIAKGHEWKASYLLEDAEASIIESELTFDSVESMEDKVEYAKASSRIALGVSNKYRASNHFSKPSLFEIRSLYEEGIVDPSNGTGAALHILAYHSAVEGSTNTAGTSKTLFPQIISKAVQMNIEKGQQEVADALLNPFDLEDGMTLYRINGKSGEIESFAIELMIENGSGLVVFGENGSEQMDLIDFNKELSAGYFMKSDSSNVFGGREYLESEFKVGSIFEGAEVRVDVTTPVDTEKKIMSARIKSTNKSELEAKYGDSYIGFMLTASKAIRMLKIVLEFPNGVVSSEWDLIDLEFEK